MRRWRTRPARRFPAKRSKARRAQGAGRAGRAGGVGGGGGGRGNGQQVQGGRAGAPAAAAPVGTKQWWLEYDTVTGTVVLNDKYEVDRGNLGVGHDFAPTNRRWSSRAATDLFMMDAKNFDMAVKKARRPGHRRNAAHDRRREVRQLRSQRTRRAVPIKQQQQQQDDQSTQGQQGGDNAAARAVSEQDKKFGVRTRAIGVSWAQDNTKFTVNRTDQRKVNDLWVIKRPGQSPADAGNLQVRHARRREPAARGARGRQHRAEEGRESEKWTRSRISRLAQESAPVTNLEREKAQGDGGRTRWRRWTRRRCAAALARAHRRQGVLQPDVTRSQAHRHRRSRHVHGRVACGGAGAVPTPTSRFSRAAHRGRQAADSLVRARRLGALLPSTTSRRPSRSARSRPASSCVSRSPRWMRRRARSTSRP